MFSSYMVRKRFKTVAICGAVNLPYGTLVDCKGGQLFTKDGRPLCMEMSQNAYDFFSHNDDGMAALRGNLVQSILDALASPCVDASPEQIEHYNSLWKKVWEDVVCNTLRRPEHEDFWIWSFDFYTAEVPILRYINKLIGGKSNV